MPSTHTILVILGALLVLSGIVGGGLSLKEFKLPTLNKFSRILACVFGVIFIVAGIYLEKIPDKKIIPDPVPDPVIIGTTPADDLEEQKKEKERLAKIEEQKKEQEKLAEIAKQKEKERLAKIEKQKKEQARLDELEKQRIKKERLDKLERKRKEQERLAKIEKQKKEQERLNELEKQRKEQERLDKLERERKEQARLAEIERQKKEQEEKKAEYTRRALDTPRKYTWHGELLIYDPNTQDTLAKGSLTFGRTIDKTKITYAQVNFDKSIITGFTDKAQATVATWGAMGINLDSNISLVFANNISNLWIHFNVLTKDYNNGYWELHGLLLKGTKLIGRVRASCRAK